MKIISEQYKPINEGYNLSFLKKQLKAAQKQYDEVDTKIMQVYSSKDNDLLNELDYKLEQITDKISTYKNAIEILSRKDKKEISQLRDGVKSDLKLEFGPIVDEALNDILKVVGEAKPVKDKPRKVDFSKLKKALAQAEKTYKEIDEQLGEYLERRKNNRLDMFDSHKMDNLSLEEEAYSTMMTMYEEAIATFKKNDPKEVAKFIADMKSDWKICQREGAGSGILTSCVREAITTISNALGGGLTGYSSEYDSDDISFGDLDESVDIDNFDGETHPNVQKLNFNPGIKKECPHCNCSLKEYPPFYCCDKEHTMECQRCQEPLGTWIGTIQTYDDNGNLVDLEETKKVRRELASKESI